MRGATSDRFPQNNFPSTPVFVNVLISILKRQLTMRMRTAETEARIVEAAYECFWRSGFARTSVDGIAERAKVTKRTIYGYFRSKDDLLAAVLTHYRELAAERLKRIGDRMPADRDGLIDSYFGQLMGWASTTPRWSGSGFTRLVVELADLPGHPARAIAKRAKAETEAWLARKLANAGVPKPQLRAREIALLTEGAMSLTLIHGGRAYIEAAAQAAKHLVKQK
ncbi:TetR/AcrR family transcriptional regulator [Tardiphaga alba]|nr:TetR/AcrR family transcriptional regulator [Tardiphaga alba]